MNKTILSKFMNKYSFDKIIKLIKNNLSTSYLVLNLLIGLIMGSFSAKNADNSFLSGLDLIFNGNIKSRISSQFFDNFVTSFSSYFIFILIIFLLGISCWGFFAVPLVVFFKGFLTGLSSGYLCSRYGLYGFMFNAVIFLPGNFLASLAILILSRECVNFSLNVLSKFISIKIKAKKQIPLKTFLIRTGLVLIIIMFASGIDVFCSSLFSKFFDAEILSNIK